MLVRKERGGKAAAALSTDHQFGDMIGRNGRGGRMGALYCSLFLLRGQILLAQWVVINSLGCMHRTNSHNPWYTNTELKYMGN